MPYSDLGLFAPEIWLCILGLTVLVADLCVSRRNRWLAPGLTAIGLLLCLRPVLALWGTTPTAEFMGSYSVDHLAVFLKAFALIAGVMVTLISTDHLRKSAGYGEYFSLLVFLVLGLCLLAAANDLILIYLSFELVSLTSYLLVAWRKSDPKSNEAAVKYFIYGATASAVMLYGLTLVYAAGGSTNVTTLAQRFMQPTADAGLALVGVLGVVLMVVGLGYKISMAPFHAWAPDVYEGAPTPVTALLSVGPKAAGFAVLVRVLFTLSQSLQDAPWQVVFAILAALTMFTGNLLALRQTNVKRMLAYSSIAHAGYMLIGVVVGPDELWGAAGLLIYLAAYLLMNLGLFAVAILLERAAGSSDIDRFAGLARTAPGVAALTILLLLSLTGIPPTAGFLGKLYLFAAAIKSQQWAWLAVAGIINSVISLYYYMNIARLMYFDKREGPEMKLLPGGVVAVLVVAAAGTLLLFAFPDWLVDAVRHAPIVR